MPADPFAAARWLTRRLAQGVAWRLDVLRARARRARGPARAAAPPLVPFEPAAARPIQRLLVTGAAGWVATMLRPALAARYPAVRLTDWRRVAPGAGEEFVRCDLADRAAVGRALAGCDAVLHLGATAREGTYAEVAGPNLAGVAHLYEQAVAQRVRRVVVASSMHVLGMSPRAEPLPPDAPPRPDGLYAASKVFAEALGRAYADKYGLEVVCLRIGHAMPRREDAEPGNWIGPDGLAAIAVAALDRPGVRFDVVPAVAAHAGDDMGQAAAARRYALAWPDAGVSYAEAMAELPARFPDDPAARYYRGAAFSRPARPPR